MILKPRAGSGKTECLVARGFVSVEKNESPDDTDNIHAQSRSWPEGVLAAIQG